MPGAGPNDRRLGLGGGWNHPRMLPLVDSNFWATQFHSHFLLSHFLDFNGARAQFFADVSARSQFVPRGFIFCFMTALQCLPNCRSVCRRS